MLSFQLPVKPSNSAPATSFLTASHLFSRSTSAQSTSALSLLYPSTDQKVVVYSPKGLFNSTTTTTNDYDHSEVHSEVEVLDFSLNSILHLSTGRISSAHTYRDIVVISSETTLTCYDMVLKCHLFKIKLSEQPQYMICASYNNVSINRSTSTQMVLLGGNCSVQGLNDSGEEIMWGICSDTVLAMASINRDELLVSCADGSVSRLFKDDIEPILELCSSKVSHLCTITSINTDGVESFMYATQSSIGLVVGKDRRWSVSLSGSLLRLLEVDGKYAVMAFENGIVEFRSIPSNGDLLHTVDCKHRLIAINYTIVRNQQFLFAIGPEGNVSLIPAYDPTDYATLVQKHDTLKQRLSAVKSDLDSIQNANKNGSRTIPADLDTVLSIRQEKTGLFLDIELHTGGMAGINFVSIEGSINAFTGCKSKISFPSFEQKITVKLDFDVDGPVKFKVLIGVSPSPDQPGVIVEKKFEVPAFSQYQLTSNLSDEELSSIGNSYWSSFGKISTDQLLAWTNKNFYTAELDENYLRVNGVGDDSIRLIFRCLRDGKISMLRIIKEGETLSNLVLVSDSLSWLSMAVPSIVTGGYFTADSATISCNMPAAVNRVQTIVSEIRNLQESKGKFGVSIVEANSNVKNLLLMAEESFLLDQFDEMKGAYLQINDVHNTCSLDMEKKKEQHSLLVERLKELNDYIQKASSLRSEIKSDIISRCRQAIGQNRLNDIVTELRLL